jgi:hypothetical protein
MLQGGDFRGHFILLNLAIAPFQVIGQGSDDVTVVPKNLPPDTAIIAGQEYIGICTWEHCVHILKNRDTVFEICEVSANFAFSDFNEDGHLDLEFGYISNVGTIIDVALFDPLKNSFVLIDDLKEYAYPVRLKDNYYYSYQKAGCADLNWISYLFKITDFTTVPIGHIYGQGCEWDTIQFPPKIEIHKVIKNEKVLIEVLPMDVIYVEDYKWGFIENYWRKNYLRFENQ